MGRTSGTGSEPSEKLYPGVVTGKEPGKTGKCSDAGTDLWQSARYDLTADPDGICSERRI